MRLAFTFSNGRKARETAGVFIDPGLPMMAIKNTGFSTLVDDIRSTLVFPIAIAAAHIIDIAVYCTGKLDLAYASLESSRTIEGNFSIGKDVQSILFPSFKDMHHIGLPIHHRASMLDRAQIPLLVPFP